MNKAFITNAMQCIYQLDAFNPDQVFDFVAHALNVILELNELSVLNKRRKYVGIG